MVRVFYLLVSEQPRIPGHLPAQVYRPEGSSSLFHPSAGVPNDLQAALHRLVDSGLAATLGSYDRALSLPPPNSVPFIL